jgi:hypothetical protein
MSRHILAPTLADVRNPDPTDTLIECLVRCRESGMPCSEVIGVVVDSYLAPWSDDSGRPMTVHEKATLEWKTKTGWAAKYK